MTNLTRTGNYSGTASALLVQQTAAPRNSRLTDPRRLAVDAGWRGPADLVNPGSVGVVKHYT
ncbi:hypothetical protein AWC06_04750 [Mycobacterium fragae]|uniref:Uncharacterized protein n=1 Tax=Mycobacterium fragae TaxID=1260918 RepID=A0A1X1V763_9MYCO|nr:hypothetical protein AWC06_04750 [Mycobacterium fragae]